MRTSFEEVHYGRSFTGTLIEDNCPCSKEACGLVSEKGLSEDCDQHNFKNHKTMRQIHSKETCPENIDVWEDEDGDLLVVGSESVSKALPKIRKYYAMCYGEQSKDIPSDEYILKILGEAPALWVDRSHPSYNSEYMEDEIFSKEPIKNWSPVYSATNWWSVERKNEDWSDEVK